MIAFYHLLAHYEKKDDTEKKQYLVEHLFAVAQKSEDTARSVKLENISKLIGLLHDLGKYVLGFQSYLLKSGARVNHSSAGAKALEHLALVVIEEYGMADRLKKSSIAKSWCRYKEMMQYVILAHHGLYDLIDATAPFHYRTEVRLAYDQEKKYDFAGEGMRFLDYINQEYQKTSGLSLQELYYKGFEEFLAINHQLVQLAKSGSEDQTIQSKSLYFYYGALMRLLLSILKDADIYDSANCFREDKDRTYTQTDVDCLWTRMRRKVDAKQEAFKEKEDRSLLDIIRTELSDNLYAAARHDKKGAYKLNLPVGAGKTFAALRYTLANAEAFHKARIFYCTAFLSVLEQNASEIKKVFIEPAEGQTQEPEDAILTHILEHHSNVIDEKREEPSNQPIGKEQEDNGESEQDSRDYEIGEYLKESWEAPFILTTLVQFSNTLFKGKASNLRRFSKLINAVMIIDEIQSLPTKAIYNFNLMTNFLAHIMHCNILHCTATEPNFDNKQTLDYPCLYGEFPGMSISSVAHSISNPEVFDRVDYFSLLGEDSHETFNNLALAAHVKDQMKEEMSTLIVLNTKAAVAQVYNALVEDTEIEKDDWEIFYLTTNQCPAHRLDFINQIKEKLRTIREGTNTRKLVCVSTRLIEAGVDIDFDLVYRSIAGLDSAVQCGGRCNREGRKQGNGRLYLFKYEGEKLGSLHELEKERSAAESVLRENQEELVECGKIKMEKASALYFKKLYENYKLEEKNYLEFVIENVEKKRGDFSPKINNPSKDSILNLLTTNPVGAMNYKNQSNGRDPEFYLKHGFKTAGQEFDLIKEDGISVIVEYKNEALLEKLHHAIDERDYAEIKKSLKNVQPYTIEIRRGANQNYLIREELDGQILFLGRNCYDAQIGLTKEEMQLLSC